MRFAKKILKRLKWVLLAVAAEYLGSCFYLSLQLYEVMHSAFESYEAVVDNPYQEIITDENYNWLIQRKDCDFDSPKAWDKYRILGPVAVHWLVGGRAIAWFDHKYYVGDDLKSGSSGVPVTFSLRLEDFRWRVVDMYIAP